MINAGKYNKQITIYECNDTVDDEGYPVRIRELLMKVYAAVKTTRGFTLITAGTDFEKAYTNFTIRYPQHTEITRDCIIVYNDREYKIEYLSNIDEAGIELEMQCKEVTH